MMHLFSVEAIAFTILGYPMSYIELVGTLFYLWSVWLISQRRILTWPIGIISVVLYMALFYQIHLYSDALEQVYYLAASAYGWWYWVRSPQTSGTILAVRFSPFRWIGVGVVVSSLLSLLLGALISRIHLIVPAWFPEPASFPYLDAWTTVMSFTAMGLMARQRIESWLYWILVDAIGIGLYYVKDVKFVSLLYVMLLGLAIRGFITWVKAEKNLRLSGS